MISFLGAPFAFPQEETVVRPVLVAGNDKCSSQTYLKPLIPLSILLPTGFKPGLVSTALKQFSYLYIQILRIHINQCMFSSAPLISPGTNPWTCFLFSLEMLFPGHLLKSLMGFSAIAMQMIHSCTFEVHCIAQSSNWCKKGSKAANKNQLPSYITPILVLFHWL